MLALSSVTLALTAQFFAFLTLEIAGVAAAGAMAEMVLGPVGGSFVPMLPRSAPFAPNVIVFPGAVQHAIALAKLAA